MSVTIRIEPGELPTCILLTCTHYLNFCCFVKIFNNSPSQIFDTDICCLCVCGIPQEQIVTRKRDFLLYYKKIHKSLVRCTGDACSTTLHEYWNAVSTSVYEIIHKLLVFRTSKCAELPYMNVGMQYPLQSTWLKSHMVRTCKNILLQNLLRTDWSFMRRAGVAQSMAIRVIVMRLHDIEYLI